MTDLMTAMLTGAVVLARYTFFSFMSIDPLWGLAAVLEIIKGMIDDVRTSRYESAERS